MTLNEFIEIVKPYTMTSVERISALYNSLEYIRINEIDGDIVECGVWKGGNILGIIEYLNFYSIENKNVWLFDTFQGMTPPTNHDIDLNNNSAISILSSVLCFSPLDEVKNNLSKSNFNKEKIKFVVGDVLNTLKNINNLPKKISLLRLDTDWYESTKKEMEILFPILEKNGILIVDDYGHWLGCKKAVDEYFYGKNFNFEKIDYTGIKLLK